MRGIVVDGEALERQAGKVRERRDEKRLGDACSYLEPAVGCAPGSFETAAY